MAGNFTHRLGNFSRAAAGNPYGFVSAGTLGENTATNGTLDVPFPSGLANNDILIVSILALSNALASYSVTTPSGWTLFQSGTLNVSGFDQFLYWYRANGSETGNQGFAYTSSIGGVIRGVMSAWGGCTTSGSPIAASAIGAGTSTSATSPTITTTQTDQVVVASVVTDDANNSGNPNPVPPSGYVEIYEFYDTTGSRGTLQASWESYASIGATGAQTTSLSTSERWSAAHFALTRA